MTLPPTPPAPCGSLLASRVAAWSRSRFGAALLWALIVLCLPAVAQAHRNGEASEGCGCHSGNGGKAPTVSITPDLMTFNPGQTINLTVSISQTNGPVAGFFLESNGPGVFSITDSGTKLAGNGVTHTAPRTGSGGVTTFKVAWTAPAAPGGVDFFVWANSANGDGSQRGDGEGTAFFSAAFGCTGNKYYHDYDGDGFGSVDSGYTMACSLPQYYSAKAGDCNDNDPKVFVGATEICDGKDNNCDGQIDEGQKFALYCTDADGDGHGASGKATMMACGASKGWGICDNDCNDADATIYPGAVELCNSRDDNCNNQIDEGARTTCGVGWCAKYAEGCGQGASTCTPGAPRAELCNDFDDDCDGVKDNGTDLELCKTPGLTCRAGYCVGAGSGSGGASSVGSGGSPSTSSEGENGGADSQGGAPGQASPPAGVAASGVSSDSGAQASAGCSFGVSHERGRAYIGLLLGAAAVFRRRRRAPQA